MDFSHFRIARTNLAQKYNHAYEQKDDKDYPRPLSEFAFTFYRLGWNCLYEPRGVQFRGLISIRSQCISISKRHVASESLHFRTSLWKYKHPDTVVSVYLSTKTFILFLSLLSFFIAYKQKMSYKIPETQLEITHPDKWKG